MNSQSESRLTSCVTSVAVLIGSSSSTRSCAAPRVTPARSLTSFHTRHCGCAVKYLLILHVIFRKYFRLNMKSMSTVVITSDTEIRKLKPAHLYQLGQILNVSDAWKKLMAIVPKSGLDCTPKFNGEHFTMIEQAVHQQRRCGAEIFLEEWGTMGRIRPTVNLLLKLLIKAQLFRAADYIAVDILKGNPPQRPQYGPAAMIDVSEEALIELLRKQEILSSDNEICSANQEVATCFGATFEQNLHDMQYPFSSIENRNDSPKSSSDKLSDLIQFSTSSISDNENVDVPPVTRPNKIINLDALSTTSKQTNLIVFSARNSCDNEDTNYEQNVHSDQFIPVVLDSCNRSKSVLNDTDGDTRNEINVVQEMSTNELPMFIAEFSPPGISFEHQLESTELPLCINEVTKFESSMSSSEENDSYETSSSSASDTNSNVIINNVQNVPEALLQNDKLYDIVEMHSVKLPQCVIEFEKSAKT
ncbi:uncharacterized protein LOC105701743 [Orussus abietinus]|uniref:uncharacterized protein LOC105701743 n=1 Tax=Orussus abietinus TaxID=222816 RepID=UPI0006267785|nr:uncharacterized protein LOC105701743 [Orussus abietinus]